MLAEIKAVRLTVEHIVLVCDAAVELEEHADTDGDTEALPELVLHNDALAERQTVALRQLEAVEDTVELVDALCEREELGLAEEHRVPVIEEETLVLNEAEEQEDTEGEALTEVVEHRDTVTLPVNDGLPLVLGLLETDSEGLAVEQIVLLCVTAVELEEHADTDGDPEALPELVLHNDALAERQTVALRQLEAVEDTVELVDALCEREALGLAEEHRVPVIEEETLVLNEAEEQEDTEGEALTEVVEHRDTDTLPVNDGLPLALGLVETDSDGLAVELNVLVCDVLNETEEQEDTENEVLEEDVKHLDDVILNEAEALLLGLELLEIEGEGLVLEQTVLL